MQDQLSVAVMAFAAMMVSACEQSPETADLSPDETYRTYFEKVSSGITFEEDKTYQSKQRIAEIESQLSRMQGGSEQATIDAYLTISQKLTQCVELSLVEERIEDTNAFLVYERIDSCGDGTVPPSEERIEMVYENGWKIVDNLTALK